MERFLLYWKLNDTSVNTKVKNNNFFSLFSQVSCVELSLSLFHKHGIHTGKIFSIREFCWRGTERHCYTEKQNTTSKCSFIFKTVNKIILTRQPCVCKILNAVLEKNCKFVYLCVCETSVLSYCSGSSASY